MRIRSAQAEDAALIAACIAMAEGELMSFFTGANEPSEQKKIMESLVLSPIPNRHDLAHCLVAEVEGVPAGMLLSFAANDQPELDKLLLENLHRRGSEVEHLFFEGARGSYYLSTMGVDPKFRGKGIGSALLRAGIERGFSLGFDRITLLVSDDKPRAKALYERIGFSVLEPVRIADTQYYRMSMTREKE